MVKYVCDDDGEEAKEEHCSTGIHHRVEHPYRDGCRVREVWHLLGKKRCYSKVSLSLGDADGALNSFPTCSTA